MSQIRIATARLRWNESNSVPSIPHLLRGAIASQFPDQPIFHQHTEKGFIYRYPMIHYRWDNKEAMIFAFGEGADSLLNVQFLDNPFRLGDKTYCIADVQFALSTHKIVESSRLMRFFFRSPWLPLNQKNYAKYQHLTKYEQQIELDRLAVANILSALKGLNIFFQDRLYVGFVCNKSRVCRYKDTSLLGFQGTLLTNIDLPSGFAIGKAVSHGYGWLERVGTAT